MDQWVHMLLSLNLGAFIAINLESLVKSKVPLSTSLPLICSTVLETCVMRSSPEQLDERENALSNGHSRH